MSFQLKRLTLAIRMDISIPHSVFFGRVTSPPALFSPSSTQPSEEVHGLLEHTWMTLDLVLIGPFAFHLFHDLFLLFLEESMLYVIIFPSKIFKVLEDNYILLVSVIVITTL